MSNTPRTMTDQEIRALLKVTKDHAQGFRDHVIFTLALKTGLRAHEVLALNIGDVFDASLTPRLYAQLKVFKESNPDPDAQVVPLNAAARAKLEQLLKQKKAQGHDLSPEAPLFVSREGGRLTDSPLRTALRKWRELAGLGAHITMHCFRHTAITLVYEHEKDITAAQRFARHASITSTGIYTRCSNQRLAAMVEYL